MKEHIDHQSISRGKDLFSGILIEDPKRQTTYFIPEKTLHKYRVSSDSLPDVSPGTVVFVLPNEQVTEQVQPFIDPGEASPSVLIQDRVNQVGYYFTFEQLKEFEVDLSFEFDEAKTVTFIIPFGWDFVENLPIILKRIGSFHSDDPPTEPHYPG